MSKQPPVDTQPPKEDPKVIEDKMHYLTETDPIQAGKAQGVLDITTPDPTVDITLELQISTDGGQTFRRDSVNTYKGDHVPAKRPADGDTPPFTWESSYPTGKVVFRTITTTTKPLGFVNTVAKKG